MEKLRISGWVYLIAGMAAIFLFLFTLVILGATRPIPSEVLEPTAILTIIAAPSSTSILQPDILSTRTPTVMSSVVIEGIGIGLYVQISGTGGDGLRLRSDANTSAEVRFLGYEAEVFLVTDGPKNSNDYIWWYLTAPYDETRSGWAVSNFIKPIDIQP